MTALDTTPSTAPTIQGAIRPDLRPSGVNHLAISTTDMKGQLTYWANVLGCPTKALYWMHGVENTYHGFVELSSTSYVAFVQHPDNRSEIDYGVTHAGNPGAPVTGGATQHIALHVDTLDDVLAMRDRIRSNGVQVMGPIDHGMIQSIYFAGPEGLNLEVCCGHDIDEQQWVDPDVQRLCGISPDELADLTSPTPTTVGPEPVPQPAADASKPRMHYPEPVYEAIMSTSDEDMWTMASHPEPPVPVPD
ncbi:MAG: VOC family protein [Ilumatobacter sp.]|uniref:VOC family protein n=1 Tax=Ilumatobacter sp. TaxID=1967498 RepID=UPI003C78097D